jgi:hypothetical protein
VSESGKTRALVGAQRSDPAGLPAPGAALHGELLPAPATGAGALLRSGGPAAQSMAIAAGGFLAGATIVGLVSRRRRRRGVRALARARRRGGETGRALPLQIVGTRSLLVDVHLLGLPGDR